MLWLLSWLSQARQPQWNSMGRPGALSLKLTEEVPRVRILACDQ